MPIYEYRCEDCGKVRSVLVKSGTGKGQKCPECGSGKTKKLMSSFAGYVKEERSSGCGSCCNAGMCPNAQM